MTGGEVVTPNVARLAGAGLAANWPNLQGVGCGSLQTVPGWALNDKDSSVVCHRGAAEGEQGGGEQPVPPGHLEWGCLAETGEAAAGEEGGAGGGLGGGMEAWPCTVNPGAEAFQALKDLFLRLGAGGGLAGSEKKKMVRSRHTFCLTFRAKTHRPQATLRPPPWGVPPPTQPGAGLPGGPSEDIPKSLSPLRVETPT